MWSLQPYRYQPQLHTPRISTASELPQPRRCRPTSALISLQGPESLEHLPQRLPPLIWSVAQTSLPPHKTESTISVREPAPPALIGQLDSFLLAQPLRAAIYTVSF